MDSKNNKINLTLYFIFIILIIFQAVHGVIGFKYNCYNLDPSIYLQAIARAGHNLDFFPFSTVRGHHIFMDHIDPIILPVGVLLRLFSINVFSLSIFEWMMALVIPFIIALKAQNKFDSTLEKIFILSLVIFSKGILDAIHFPIHPTTWAITGIFFFLWAMERSNFWHIIAGTLFLSSFKEIFPIAIFLSGLYGIFIQKNIKVGISISSISAIFIFVFLKKAELFEFSSTIDFYVHDRLQVGTLMSLTKLKNRFNDLSFWKEVFKVTIPYLIPLALVIRKDKKILKSSSFHHSMIMFASMFGIHVFSKSIGYHYSITIVAPLIFFLMNNFNLNASDHKKSIIFCIILLFITSMGRHTRAIARPFKSTESACTHDKTKELEITKLQKIIKGFDTKDKHILSTGGVLPRLITANANYYQTKSYSKKQNSYDLLILEQYGQSRLWKVSKSDLNKAWNICKKDEIILDGNHFLVIKSPSKNCFSLVN